MFPQPEPEPPQTHDRPLRCDFCGVLDIAWEYECADFVLITVTGQQRSQGSWAACVLCHALIEANDWTDLAYRSVIALLARSQREYTGTEQLNLFSYMRELHRGFNNNRNPNPWRINNRGDRLENFARAAP